MALAVLTLSPQRRALAGSPVLAASEWRALRQASELVDAAQAAVDQARAEALARLRDEQAQTAAQHERRRQHTLLLKALSLQVEYERLRHELRDRFVETQLTCLRALLRDPLPAAFFARVEESARHYVGQRAALALHVAPADEAAARDGIGNASAHVELCIDPELLPGQCHLQTEFGRLQAGLEVQLEAIHEALERWWQGAAKAETPAGATTTPTV
jgi:flagellar biosynthesis/type III secretory pathway protein FliH